MRRTQKSPETAPKEGAQGAGPDEAAAGPALLSREVDQAALNRRREIAVEIEAADAERAAVAEHLGLLSLAVLRLSGALRPHRTRGWIFEGALEAQLEQRCVATLAAAPAEIDEAVERIWLPSEEIAALEAEAMAAGLSPDDIDLDAEEPEALPETLDLGPVAVEALALALDPYPRAPDAAFADHAAGPPGVAPLTDDDVKPFAGLAALKARLESAEGDATDDQNEDGEDAGGEKGETKKNDTES